MGAYADCPNYDKCGNQMWIGEGAADLCGDCLDERRAAEQEHQSTQTPDGAARTHELKCWPRYFKHVLNGDKTFEIREEGDRFFNYGDILHLREWNPDTKEYTGRECWRRVKFSYSGVWMAKNYKCMSIEPVPAPAASGAGAETAQTIANRLVDNHERRYGAMKGCSTLRVHITNALEAERQRNSAWVQAAIADVAAATARADLAEEALAAERERIATVLEDIFASQYPSRCREIALQYAASLRSGASPAAATEEGEAK